MSIVGELKAESILISAEEINVEGSIEIIELATDLSV
jgi:hypothetical protein